MRFRAEGNFNTIGKTYSLFGNDLYFVKYDRKTSVAEAWSEKHFVTFLTHEAFHYYRQSNWPEGSRFSTDSLTEEELSLLAEEYQILGEMQTQLLSQSPDRDALESAARTIEASRRVGYDYGVMYFTNQKNIPFQEIMPQYQAGNLDKSFLADRMPYETGALLCQLMDELGLPDWQKALNEQTAEAPVSLYGILKKWAES